MLNVDAGSMKYAAQAERQDDEVGVLLQSPLAGGESRSGQLTGTKALMLAVLEDGIRSYLSGPALVGEEAAHWIRSPRNQSPFSFVVICETLGLDPEAVRTRVRQLKQLQVSARQAMPRARHNVRIPGRVCPRRAA
jgi:hypothetical protein